MKKNNSQKGFTLIEILITAVVTVILAGGILTLQYIIGQNQVTAWKSYVGINEANASTSSLVAELRTARNGENGAYPLEKADSSEIIFYSDVDFDESVERVRYFLTGTTFSRGVTKSSGFPISYLSANEKVKIISTIVRNGTDPIFYYYNNGWPLDTANNPLTTPASPVNVKLIKISIRLNADAQAENKDFVLENFTQIRMLKSNL
jgi:prepilin-type N-terminal cleavage/methylation domain-containing protein